MKPEKLQAMQERAKKRYGFTVPEPEGTNIAKTCVMISEAINNVRVTRKKKEKVILPDLMAAQPVSKKPEVGFEFVEAKKINPVIEKKEKSVVVKPSKPIFETPPDKSIDFTKLTNYSGPAIYNPKSREKDAPRVAIPEKEDKPFVRPPAVYSNSKSLYNIDYNNL